MVSLKYAPFSKRSLNKDCEMANTGSSQLQNF